MTGCTIYRLISGGFKIHPKNFWGHILHEFDLYMGIYSISKIQKIWMHHHSKEKNTKKKKLDRTRNQCLGKNCKKLIEWNRIYIKKSQTNQTCIQWTLIFKNISEVCRLTKILETSSGLFQDTSILVVSSGQQMIKRKWSNEMMRREKEKDLKEGR